MAYYMANFSKVIIGQKSTVSLFRITQNNLLGNK